MIIDTALNLTNTFSQLLSWMPKVFQEFCEAVFLFFVCSAMLNIITKFVKFVRG